MRRLNLLLSRKRLRWVGMNCKVCGTENKDDFNFCRKCGTKLKDECMCWVKKEPYNCGKDNCPGYSFYKKVK